MTSYAHLDAITKKIDSVLIDAGAPARVHSLQLMLVRGKTLDRPISYLFSKEWSALEACVHEFTRYVPSTNRFSRSLATYDVSDGPWRLDSIPCVGGVGGPQFSRDAHSFEFWKLAEWEYEEPATTDPEKDFHEWIVTVAKHFPHLDTCSTLWVSQAYSEERDSAKSSAFLILDHQVPAASYRRPLYHVSRILRDELIKALVNEHRKLIESQAEVEAALLKSLSENDSSIPLSPSVWSRIDRYISAVTSSVPILVVGEMGTGKLAVAREVGRLRDNFVLEVSRRRSAPSDPQADPRRLIERTQSLNFLAGKDPDEVRRRLQPQPEASDKNGVSWVIVVDDIHLANTPVQDQVMELLDRYLPTGTNGDSSSRYKFVFTSLPGLDALATEGRFSPSLLAQISPFEIVCQPLRDRFEDPGDADRILKYAGNAVSRALSLPEPPQLTTNEEQRLKAHRWPANFRDLYNYLIRLFLEKERDKADRRDRT